MLCKPLKIIVWLYLIMALQMDSLLIFLLVVIHSLTLLLELMHYGRMLRRMI